MNPAVSRSGVYYDKTISPHVHVACGETFRFSSEKKKEMFCRELPRRIERIERAFTWINKFAELDNKMDMVWKLMIAEKLYKDLEVDKWRDGKRVLKTSEGQAKP